MATRSRIGIKLENGYVRSIYAHWDGYPSGNGNILFNYYTDVTKINQLLDLGDVSSLQKEIAPPEELIEFHSFENPVENVTTFYHRDRGEREHPAQISTEKQFYVDLSEEYNYLFKDGKWFVNGEELTKEMIK
jgi:hypothetical protein